MHPAWFGTSVGTSQLPGPLKATLLGLGLELDLLGVLGDPVLSLQEVSNAVVVDTDEPSTGSRIDFDLGAVLGGARLGAIVSTPWSVPTRPPVTAQASTFSAIRSYRYLVAALRTDGTESVPGAASSVVHAAVASAVTVTTPSSPSIPAFAAWRLYRSRLTPSGWATPVHLADVQPGAYHQDTIQSNVKSAELESQLTPPVPGSLELQWGTPATLIDPSPLGLPLSVRTYDEDLPYNTVPDAWLKLTSLSLPATGSASFHPNRGTITPLTASWDAASTPLTAHFTKVRSKTDVQVVLAPLPRVDLTAHLDATQLASVTWDASSSTVVTGHLHLPPGSAVGDHAVSRDVFLQPILSKLQSVNILSRGHFGAWRYETSNQDHSFMQGADAARLILTGTDQRSGQG